MTLIAALGQDMCSAKGHVRFTAESGHSRLRIGMSAERQKRT